MTPGPERKGHHWFVPGTPIGKIHSPPPARLPIFEEIPAEAPTKAVPGVEVLALIHADVPQVAQSPRPLEEVDVKHKTAQNHPPLSTAGSEDGDNHSTSTASPSNITVVASNEARFRSRAEIPFCPAIDDLLNMEQHTYHVNRTSTNSKTELTIHNASSKSRRREKSRWKSKTTSFGGVFVSRGRGSDRKTKDWEVGDGDGEGYNEGVE